MRIPVTIDGGRFDRMLALLEEIRNAIRAIVPPPPDEPDHLEVAIDEVQEQEEEPL